MRFFTILLLLVLAMPISAQTATPTPSSGTNCGNGLPCGPVPWRLPELPALESPTPLDLSSDQSANPGATNTPTPDFLSDLTQVVEFADEVSLTGTPFDFEITEEAEYENLITNASTFFSYVKGLSLADLGIITPILTGFFVLTTLTILLKITLFLLPIVGVIAGLIRKIIELIPGF